MATDTRAIQLELTWFTQVLDTRMKRYFEQESEFNDIYDIPAPELGDSFYAQTIAKYELGLPERIALMLALVPHINPRLLDIFFTKNATFDRPFTEFGGYTHPQHQGFLPTGETLAFILAGNDLERRMEVLQLFRSDHFFSKNHLLLLEDGLEDSLPLSGKLSISTDFLYQLTMGNTYRRRFNNSFPAQLIDTQQEWRDLVLPDRTLKQIQEIASWIKHGPTLMDDWGMRRKLRPGYRCLFYGPPGTGKTMTACLLGKSTGRPVYRVDLSSVVSKYIGETEKNLSKIFNQAEHKDWILFFDEADALFGKRTAVRDAHDRFANQEVSFLLQRVETFDGITILASNLRENMDDAFIRRFESMIYFAMPKAAQRLNIWQQGFSPKAELAPEIDLAKIANKYELSGGGIMNVVRFASLQALDNGGVVQLDYLMEGIGREYGKEGRSL